jgi:hypothetical protein
MKTSIFSKLILSVFVFCIVACTGKDNGNSSQTGNSDNPDGVVTGTGNGNGVVDTRSDAEKKQSSNEAGTGAP